MASSRPRLAVIGAGRWGSVIIKTLLSFPDASLSYVVTGRGNISAQFPAFKGKQLRNYKELLKKRDLDGVLIATPASTHTLIATPFLKRGLPVFIEKPMTTKLSDAM